MKILCCNRAKVGVRKFYEKQNDLVEAWKEDEKVLTTTVDHAAQAEKDQRVKVWDTRLATITIILNVFLIAAKTTAAILSDSLSVVASVVDSGFIIITWLMTVREQIPLLIGKTADPQLINRIVNVAISHDDRIKHLDTVYVYHFGANFLVELHVVMDREISLCDAHDVSETLQNKLEQLSFVERAFVHCDYQFDGDEHV
ncbi:cation efflux family protein [Ancylostoma ceylanicum]|uniref:Cation efflux family protein n=1 Tax=Ancylostoma ceylanicum TaxID=53326 RepID=A0A0D6LD95_9BILA|nr:cation efflux family protein [Ancylostoma ceylanicum]